ncbi:MAG: FAD-binding protein [Chloroflexi bacterium]|nr:FAD-binding protein [Chloroflexota bacterium]
MIWKSWAETVVFEPGQMVHPSSLEGIVDTVKGAARGGKSIRVVGSGHSWMPLVRTDHILVSLDHYQGIEAIDKDKMTATVRAGTTLEQLGAALFEQGLAMENLGDIHDQALAGALSTGTHGTGVTLGSLSTQMVGVTLVTAQGEVLEWDEISHPDEMNAVRVSLGMLGIIARITLRVVPTYRLKVEQYKEPLTKIIANLEENIQNNRHFEFFWFPYTGYAIPKRIKTTDEPAVEQKSSRQVFNEILEQSVVTSFFSLSRSFSFLGRALNNVFIALVADEDPGYVDHSYRVFPTTRTLRFQEMEYSIPAELLPNCLEEIIHTVEVNRFKMFFPTECRWVKGDEIWLSPAYQRDSAYIAVQQTKGSPYEDYFRQIEPIFHHYDGRPHWGKLNTFRHEHVAACYPRLPDFMALRQQLAPEQMFLNDYLKRTFMG